MDLIELAGIYRAAREYQQAAEDAFVRGDEMLVRAYAEGATVAQLAALRQVSPQRTYQLIAAAREAQSIDGGSNGNGTSG